MDDFKFTKKEIEPSQKNNDEECRILCECGFDLTDFPTRQTCGKFGCDRIISNSIVEESEPAPEDEISATEHNNKVDTTFYNKITDSLNLKKHKETQKMEKLLLKYREDLQLKRRKIESEIEIIDNIINCIKDNK